MQTHSQRQSYLIAFLFVVALLLGATYLQISQGLNPCPLCILQRGAMCLLGVVFLLGILLSPYRMGRMSVGFLSLLFSSLGLLLSGRQVWLQLTPSGMVANCEVSLEYMLSALPLHEVAKKIFNGSASCEQVSWQFMHLSLAEWSLLSFVLLFVFSLRQLRRS